MTDRVVSDARIRRLEERLRVGGSVFAEAEAATLFESAADTRELERLLQRRLSGEPLEHVVGWVGFGRLRLAVGPGVFVPRQRSLLLARAAVRGLRERPGAVMLEPFCGVAPIAATVAASLSEVSVHVADRDDVALEHARRNVPGASGVHRSDGFRGLPASLRSRCSLIAAVPPYVPSGSIDLMPREARDHEPRAALTGGADGLDHVRTIVAEAAEWLSEDGVVLVELHRSQFRAAAAAGRARGWTPTAHRGSDGQTMVLELRPG